MQGVLFALFRNVQTAEKALAALAAAGLPPEAAILHRQDVPIAGTHEERPGSLKPADDAGVFSGLFHSLFDSGREMDASSHIDTVRQALNRGEYAVSVRTDDAGQMATAERVFTQTGAVLQLHPEA